VHVDARDELADVEEPPLDRSNVLAGVPVDGVL